MRFVVAPHVILADTSESSHLPQAETMAQEFKAKFDAAFPNQMFSLERSDEMISPNERFIVIVPTITVARMTDELIAGSIHNFEAAVVGDVSAIDPWTDASLYSATRMVNSKFTIGDREMADLDSRAREAFRTAYGQWLDATMEQLRTNFKPFVLDGVTLTVPGNARQFKGGIWPFGAKRGVKVGQTLNGGDGRYARVEAALPEYSLISDITDSGRLIPPGESYSLTLVDKPAERPEPRVALSWLGSPPSTPEGNATLSAAAMVSLFDNYLSKTGGIKVLSHNVE